MLQIPWEDVKLDLQKRGDGHAGLGKGEGGRGQIECVKGWKTGKLFNKTFYQSIFSSFVNI